jgi:hypothetical protein
VAGGYVGALVVLFAAARWTDPTTSFRTGLVRPVCAALLASAVMALPPYLAFTLSGGGKGIPTPPPNWSVVIPVALDLDLPSVQLVTRQTTTWLLVGCAVLLVALLGVALARREPVAAALLGTALLVPVARLVGLHELHLFHGLLYPLTLAGAALLVVPRAGRRWPVLVTGALLLGVIGLRVPQGRAAESRYVYKPNLFRVVISQSEAEAIRSIVGTDPVDVWMAQWPDNCYAVTDLAPNGIDVRLRSPAWERSIQGWARLGKCPEPDLLGPKSRFTLLERGTFAPPETVRYVGRRYQVCEDARAITLVGITSAQLMSFDAEWRPVCWIGNAPTTFLINNGTGRARSVVLHTRTSAGPAHPDLARRTLAYRLGARAGTVSVPGESLIALSLHLEPGLNRLELRALEAPSPEPAPNIPVQLLALYYWRLEPADALSRAEQH